MFKFEIDGKTVLVTVARVFFPELVYLLTELRA